MTTIRERFEALRTEAAAEIVRLEREAQEARDVLAALSGKPPAAVVETPPTEAQGVGAREYIAEGAHAFGKRAYHGRVTNARLRMHTALASGPDSIGHLATVIYGDSSDHSVGKARRIIEHMQRDGHLVTIEGDFVRMV